MQRYEDVAIPMQANLKDVEIINQTTLYDFDALIKSRPCHIFSDEDMPAFGNSSHHRYSEFNQAIPLSL